ncbi:hypothetical protein E2C01_043724 [Portunus trituberculatus]|uniref:Uncharacterized protein n=1 Tax=Portunus trituberculatus TaxID=210409 RepID=A0A5B7FXH2_PORTR|nr:hypothetical protein [Portunus trituberculatus]
MASVGRAESPSVTRAMAERSEGRGRHATSEGDALLVHCPSGRLGSPPHGGHATRPGPTGWHRPWSACAAHHLAAPAIAYVSHPGSTVQGPASPRQLLQYLHLSKVTCGVHWCDSLQVCSSGGDDGQDGCHTLLPAHTGSNVKGCPPCRRQMTVDVAAPYPKSSSPCLSSRQRVRAEREQCLHCLGVALHRSQHRRPTLSGTSTCYGEPCLK